MSRPALTLVVLRPVPCVATWTPCSSGLPPHARARRWNGDYLIECIGAKPWIFWWPYREPMEWRDFETYGDGAGSGRVDLYDGRDGGLDWTRRINGHDHGSQRVPTWLHVAAAEDGAEILGIPVPIFQAMYTTDPPPVWMPS